jgi:hypothetical protein
MRALFISDRVLSAVAVGLLVAAVLFAPALAAHNGGAGTGLAGTTVLIIRHAEKPDSGPGLASAGQQRAQAYVRYFENFTLDGVHSTPDYLVSSADSDSSQRPRLTIEPLSQALQLRIHDKYKDRQFAALASDLESRPHGHVILIAWHHGEIPDLLQALGVDPSTVLPAPKWPSNVFGWVIAVQYDAAGRPAREELIHENLMPDDAGQ